MKKIITSIFLVLTFASQLLFAHADHSELTQTDAMAVAKTHVDQLVVEKKLPDSWKSASSVPDSAAVKAVEGKKRWSVTFENAKETDAAKKKLEMLLTPGGKFVSFQFVK